MVLGQNAVLTHNQAMMGRINELNSGLYRICYATASSGADSDADFNPLTSALRISKDEHAPVLTVAPIVNLGQDIVVGWEAGNYDGRISDAFDWLGLYRQGDCEQIDYYSSDLRRSDRAQLKNAHGSQLKNAHDIKSSVSQNQCFIASTTLTTGQAQGEARFSTKQYGLKAGNYVVRYFKGESLSGAGYVCRGMQQTGEDAYRICALEAKATSAIIKVSNTFADGTYQHLSAQENIPQAMQQGLPGLETFCMGPECGDV